jgi:riboflavin biosynthesis pyrimidine reductase
VARNWQGISEKFSVLFQDAGNGGQQLPADVNELYGAWSLPEFADRPYVYSNFVMSHDGHISFNMPEFVGGGPVSLYNAHDQWLMALLRARADAVMVGANTLRAEPDHIWTAEFICPKDAERFSDLRREEGRTVPPLQIFVSHDGEIRADAEIFRTEGMKIIVATPAAGIPRARDLLQDFPNVQLVENGERSVDLKTLLSTLRKQYDVRSLLCEGGPHLYGSLLAADCIDDEFLTVSPIVIGNARDSAVRPNLVEGAAFVPSNTPKARLLGIRKVREHLFLHTRFK